MGIRYSGAFIQQAIFKVYSRGERTVKPVAVELTKPIHRSDRVAHFHQANRSPVGLLAVSPTTLFKLCRKSGRFENHQRLGKLRQIIEVELIWRFVVEV
jgi:hypothetical protein